MSASNYCTLLMLQLFMSASNYCTLLMLQLTLGMVSSIVETRSSRLSVESPSKAGQHRSKKLKNTVYKNLSVNKHFDSDRICADYVSVQDFARSLCCRQRWSVRKQVPQIANPQIFGLNFFRFEGLPRKCGNLRI